MFKKDKKKTEDNIIKDVSNLFRPKKQKNKKQKKPNAIQDIRNHFRLKKENEAIIINW